MSPYHDLPILVVGAGGHGRVTAATLLRAGRQVDGFLDADPSVHGRNIFGLPVLGDDSLLSPGNATRWLLANGIGGAGGSSLRRRIYEHCKEMGYSFVTVVDPSAVVSLDVELGEGVHLFAGSVVQPCVRIGDNSIVNTRASVDHDCVLEAHVHIAPGATVSGSVHIGAETHIGTGASVRQGVKIGKGALIGVGAAVVSDIADNATAVGVPARPTISR